MNSSISQQLDQQSGVDIRPSSTAIFGISSFDRFGSLAEKNGNDLTNFNTAANATISSRQPFISGQFQRIGVTEVVLRWTLPTLTENNNKIRIDYQVNAVGPVTRYDLAVPTNNIFGGAWYTPTTLAAQIQILVRALPIPSAAGFTMVADTTTGQFTGRTNNTDLFLFRPFVVPSLPNKIGLFEMMNWLSYPDPSPAALAIEISGVPSMCRTQFVDIVCSQLTGCQGVKDADTGDISRDVLCRVYLNDGLTTQPQLVGSTPFTVYRQFSVPKQIKWLPNTSVGGFLQFQLYDDQGYPLTGGPTTIPLDQKEIGDWNLTLQLSEV